MDNDESCYPFFIFEILVDFQVFLRIFAHFLAKNGTFLVVSKFITWYIG